MVCLYASNPLCLRCQTHYATCMHIHVHPWKQTKSLTANQSLDCRITQQQKSEHGNNVHTPLSKPAKRTSKRFLYEGRRGWGDSLKAFLDTQLNGPTSFHTIAPASQIALVIHNVFTGKKKKKITIELKYGALYWVDVWRAFLFYREILQDSDIIFHNKIKLTLQLQAKASAEIARKEKKIMNQPIIYKFAENRSLIILGTFFLLSGVIKIIFQQSFKLNLLCWTYTNSWHQELPLCSWNKFPTVK